MDRISREVTYVSIHNPVDVDTTPAVKPELEKLLARPGQVILDVRAAAVDSTGLGAILSFQRRLELQDRRLLVVADSREFSQLLDRTGARDALHLFQDPEQAFQSAVCPMAAVA